MEKDDEVKGEGNSYNYGARIQDPRLGKFLSSDPLADAYPGVSPYAFALNTPIQAYDPDGRLVLFVNGFRFGVNGFLGNDRDASSYHSAGPWQETWGRDKTWDNDFYGYWVGVDEKFKARIGDDNAVYADGSYYAFSTAAVRERGGAYAGRDILAKIESGEYHIEEGESIKIVTHSMGTAYANGAAQVLIDAGYLIEVVYNLAPKHPSDIETPSEVQRAVQYGSNQDMVAVQSNMIGFPASNREIYQMPELSGPSTNGSPWSWLNHILSTGTEAHSLLTYGNHIFSIQPGQRGYVAPRQDTPASSPMAPNDVLPRLR